jgi:electron transfer flavoprotein alpha subunit
MKTYNANIGCVLVYIEQRHGRVASIIYELLNEAKRISNELNIDLNICIIGYNLKLISNEFMNKGVDCMYIYDNPAFYEFCDGYYSEILIKLIKEIKPKIVFIGATNIGKSIAPRIAASLKTGLTSYCNSFEIDNITKKFYQIKHAFDNNIMVKISIKSSGPQIVTVQNKIFKKQNLNFVKNVKIINCNTDVKLLKNKVKFLGFIKNENIDNNFINSKIIVSCGRGLNVSKGISLIKEFADVIGGVVCASRPIVDLGLVPYLNQIGQSCKKVFPKIYIACGISGQIQHTVGIDSSSTIVAINKDPTCNMMKMATYALVGDMYEIIPKIIKKIKAHKI